MRTRIRIVAALASIVLLAAAPAFARGYLQNPALLEQIKAGVTTSQEVEQILGPPASRSDFSRLGQISMNYSMEIWDEWYDVGIMIGTDGIVRDVQKIKRYGGGN